MVVGERGAPVPETAQDALTLPPGVALTVAAVARRLGVAPATLRTWDRRYGLGPSGRTSGAHRRYTAADLARLETMRRLVLAGVPSAEAAGAAVAGLDVGAEAITAPEPRAPGAAGDDAAAPGGGAVVALPGAPPAARGLARAAMSLDSYAVADMVRASIDRRGVIWTWDQLVAPVLVGVGTRWERTGEGVEVEHLVSDAVMGVLRATTDRLRAPVNPRPALLAACRGAALAAAVRPRRRLSERRVGCRILGARVPGRPGRCGAPHRSGVVVLWSHLPAAGESHLPVLPDLRPAPLLLLAGPGWNDLDRARVRHLGDLTEAVAAVAGAVGV
jgi:hypothetical protein